MARKKKEEDGPATPEEVNLLRSLERAERKIGRLIGAKEDDVDQHNAAIKEAKNDRAAVLAALQDYRNGVQALPLD